MLVTDQKQHVTHAVLGGGQSIDFGISSDPAFFHILSSSLYKNSKKAVVRETICNGWDAHIDAGVTLPIQLTLTYTEFVIRDFGKGIPDALIGPIYAVYGGSTKKNDGKQTGGFGLGCKAPFAYADTFTVTSWNQGTKTVYVMSKSSNDVQGKPAIRAVVSTPTTETGLEVRIPISFSDRHRFEALIKEIIFFGGIQAQLNGYAVETIDYESCTEDFALVKLKTHMPEQSGRVMLKYGNVVYPIDNHPDYDADLKWASSPMRWFQNGSSYTTILLAPPDSISVTPSRETLSAQDNTQATLKKLLASFRERIEQTMEIGTKALVDQTIVTAQQGEFHQIINHIRVPFGDEHEEVEAVSTTDKLGRIRIQYDSRNSAVNADYSELCDELLVKHDVVKPKMFAEMMKARRPRKWIFRNIVARLLTRMPKEMKRSRLSFVAKGNGYYDHWRKYDLDSSHPFDDHLREMLRQVVVLSFTSDGYHGRVAKFPKEHGISPQCHLLYQVPRSEKRAQQARDYFTKMGCKVIDLTVVQTWEGDHVITPIQRNNKPAVKRTPGIPLVSVGGSDDGGNKLHHCLNPDAKRIEKPEWVVYFADTIASREYCDFHNKRRIGDMSGRNTSKLISLFGATGGIVRNEAQRLLYIKNGSLDMHEYIFTKLKEAFTNNQNIINYVATNGLSNDRGDIHATIRRDAELCKHFGLIQQELTKEEWMLMDLFREEYNVFHLRAHRMTDRATEVKTIIEAIPKNAATLSLEEKLEVFEQTQEYNFYDLSRIARSIRADDANAALARTIITNHLK